MASSRAAKLSGSVIRIVGASTHCAPAASSSSVSRLACSRARVTRIRWPNNGRSSNQRRPCRKFTTSPTTKIAGGVIPCAATSATALPTVVIRVFCCGVVPQRITAAGVSAARPLAISCVVIWGRFSTPIKNTSVSTAVASLSHCMPDSVFSGSSWPVTTANEVAIARCVTGIPA